MSDSTNADIRPVPYIKNNDSWLQALPVEDGKVLSDDQLYQQMILKNGCAWGARDGNDILCATRHVDIGLAKMHKYCVKLAQMSPEDVSIPVYKRSAFPTVKQAGLGLFYGAMCHYLDEYKPFYHYSEYLEAAFELAKDFEFIEDDRKGRMSWVFVFQTTDGIEYCNQYFKALYDVYQSADFKEKLRNRQRQSQKIASRLSLLIFKLFYIDKISRLCVVRLDLDYKRTSAAEDVSPYFLENRPDEMAVDVVQDDLRRFFNGIRGLKLFKGKIAGYAWRMQFGEGAGYHFHIILFLDGTKTYQDLRYAKAAIGLWKRVVGTSARGHSSNFKKRQFLAAGKVVGVGMINRNDTDKVKALHDVAAYLAHQDQLLNVKPGKACKTFGCSKIGEIDEDLLAEHERLTSGLAGCDRDAGTAMAEAIDSMAVEYRRRGRMRGMAQMSEPVRSARQYVSVHVPTGRRRRRKLALTVEKPT